MGQISDLRREHEAAEKKRSEIDKVALILGLNPSDRPRRTSRAPLAQENLDLELDRSPEGREAASSSTVNRLTGFNDGITDCHRPSQTVTDRY